MAKEQVLQNWTVTLIDQAGYLNETAAVCVLSELSQASVYGPTATRQNYEA